MTKTRLQPKRRPPITVSERAAYHEAAHAVVALEVADRLPIEVSIVSGPQQGRQRIIGNCAFEPDDGRCLASREAAERRVLTCMAGMASLLHLRPKTGITVAMLSGGLSDWDEAEFVLSPFCTSDKECSQELNRLLQRTREIIRQPRVWAAIEYVAKRLLRTPVLEGETLAAVIGDVLE